MYEPVTIGVINYNGGEFVERCISSILHLDYPRYTVMVVDNKSTDESLDIIRRNFPGIEIIELNENRGPKVASNLICRQADTRLVLCMDNDVVIKKDCLRHLVDAMTQFPEAVVCGPKVMYYDDPSRVQFGIIKYHYIGAAIHELPRNDEPVEVSSVGGATILIDMNRAQKAGLYDEDFFFGWTDGEFCLRQVVAGHKCYYVPQAVIYHREKERGLSKIFYQVRNRWFLLLKVYRWKTLFLIAPALCIYELTSVIFFLFKGKMYEYLRANIAILKGFRNILMKRRRVQALRKVSDRQVLQVGKMMLRDDIFEGKRLVLVAFQLQNSFFDIYWKAVKRLV